MASAPHTTRRAARSVQLLVLACVLIALAAVAPTTRAFQCSSCQYTARNCSTLDSDSATSTSDSIAVCDATGKIQIDDVFCDNDECQCASDKRCASLVVGCTNIFQARSRKRCIGLDAEHRRFQKCAIAQNLTTLNASNLLAADWVMFKDPTACTSTDCAAVRQFHHSGVVQCGYLVIAWRDAFDASYHFIVDGSRARDMAPGVFHYVARPDATNGALNVTSLQDTQIAPCWTLQTRNNGHKSDACDGYYIQYDTSVQLSHDNSVASAYDLSILPWSAWCAVVGSVAAAVVAVVGVAITAYRLRTLEQGGDGSRNDDDDSDTLLCPKKVCAKNEDLGTKPTPRAETAARDAHATVRVDLRQRTLSPRSARDDDATTAQV